MSVFPSRDRTAHAMINAADWLEANPDKHIRGRLATDRVGRGVATTDPEATCFCAVGRVGHNLGMTESTYIIRAIDNYDDGHTLASRIVRSNDFRGPVPVTLGDKRDYYDGRKVAINLMRAAGHRMLAE